LDARDATESVSHDSQSPSRKSIPESHIFEAEVLTIKE